MPTSEPHIQTCDDNILYLRLHSLSNKDLIPSLREVRKEWVTKQRAREMMRLSYAGYPVFYPKIPVKDPLWLHQAVENMGHVILGCDHFWGRVVFVHCHDLFQN